MADAPVATAAGRSPLRVLSNRSFLGVYLAGAFSIVGAVVAGTMIPWVVYTETRSAYQLALVGVVGTIPTIVLGFLAGALVDRVDRRRLMIAADIGRAVTMGVLALVFVAWGFSLLAVLVAIVLVESMSTVFRPASNALLPSILESADLEDGNGLLQGTQASLGIPATAATGLLLVFGADVGFGVNALTYVLSALFLLLVSARVLRSAAPPGPSPPTTPLVESLRVGFGFFRRHPVVYLGTFAGLWINFLSNLFFRFTAVYSSERFGPSPEAFALFSTGLPIGFALGAILTGRLRASRRAGWAWILTTVASGATMFGLAAVSSLPVALLLLVVMGLSFGIVSTTYIVAMQALVPNRLLGRVLSVDEVGSFALLPLAPVVGAILVVGVGMTATLVVAGAGLVATALFLAASGPVRGLRIDRHTRPLD